MRKFVVLLGLWIVFSGLAVLAQNPVKYSSAFFGAHSLPVPEVTNGKIPEFTTLGLSTDYSFGFGDQTVGLRFDAEIPLLPKYISLNTWMVFYEKYWLTPEVCEIREIDPPVSMGTATGDLYVQTRLSVLSETQKRPQIVIDITLRTASGKFKNKRFHDTPAYYFDASISKSISVNTNFLKDIRFVLNGGFLCWETTNSTQNDAPMYGFNFMLSNSFLCFENQIGGYWGWMNNGDHPLVYSTKLTYSYRFFSLSFLYRYGIMDFPYHQIQFGLSGRIPQITPKYQNKKSNK
jgi:hypothetical protein